MGTDVQTLEHGAAAGVVAVGSSGDLYGSMRPGGGVSGQDRPRSVELRSRLGTRVNKALNRCPVLLVMGRAGLNDGDLSSEVSWRRCPAQVLVLGKKGDLRVQIPSKRFPANWECAYLPSLQGTSAGGHESVR